MKKMITAAMVLLVVQIGLMLALNIGSKGIEAGSPDTLFLNFSQDAVQSIEITDTEGKKILVEKTKGGWIMPAHYKAPVAANKVQELLGKLAEMKQGFTVASSAEAAKRFKVDGAAFADHVVLKGADRTLADFYVGSSPVFRQVYARRGDSSAIVTIALSSFELQPAPEQWLDTSVATIKQEGLIALTLGDVKLKKATDGWELEGRNNGENINRQEVEALVNKVCGIVVQDVLDPGQVANLFDQPALRFTAVEKGDKSVEYLFAKGKGDFYVLKMSGRDLYFKVPTMPVETLQKITRENLIAVAAGAGEKDQSAEQK